MRTLGQRESEAHPIVVSAMLTVAGSVHTRCSVLNYQVFMYNHPVCYEAFYFCYDLNERTLTRWRKEMRTRSRFVSRRHGLIGRNGVIANRASNQVQRSRVTRFLGTVSQELGEQNPTQPGDLVFLPAYMTKRLLYPKFRDEHEIHEDLPSWRSFGRLCNEDMDHIRAHSTEKGMCSACVNMKHRLRGLPASSVTSELE